MSKVSVQSSAQHFAYQAGLLLLVLMNALTRREFVSRGVATLIGAAGLSSCSFSQTNSTNISSTEKRLNIFSWADYLHPEAIPEFERRFGIKVVYDTFASNESLLARMQAGSVDYDVIVPTSYAISKLKKLNLLSPIEKDRLSNYKYLMPRFRDLYYDPGNKYSIPYTFGTTGIAYNKQAWREAGAGQPRDWNAFWDPRFAGRMTLLEDARESLGLALKRKGCSYNSVSEKEIDLAMQDLAQQKPLNMCYSSDQVIIYMASGDSYLSLAFSGDAHQAKREAQRYNREVGYIIPESGASLWIDNMAIPSSAPHKDNAHKWINYILEPAVAAQLTNFTYYPTPNTAVRHKIQPELLADKTLYPDDDVMDRCEQIHDIGAALLLYDRAWTELKCL